MLRMQAYTLVSLGTFSRASFAIQPRPRLRTLLDGAGPETPGGEPSGKNYLKEALYLVSEVAG